MLASDHRALSCWEKLLEGKKTPPNHQQMLFIFILYQK